MEIGYVSEAPVVVGLYTAGSMGHKLALYLSSPGESALAHQFLNRINNEQ